MKPYGTKSMPWELCSKWFRSTGHAAILPTAILLAFILLAGGITRTFPGSHSDDPIGDFQFKRIRNTPEILWQLHRQKHLSCRPGAERARSGRNHQALPERWLFTGLDNDHKTAGRQNETPKLL